MGGMLGGSQTTNTEIPQWLEDPSKRAIERGEQIAQLDYMPYMGPSVAAFSPMQEAAFGNTNAAASAFGLGAGQGTGMPAPQDYGGFSGYSAFPIYQQSVDQFAAAFPELAAQRDSFFGAPVPGGTQGQGLLSSGGGGSDDRRYRSVLNRDRPSGGGFTSVRDMFDGGGAGTSGDTFKGGPLSSRLNDIGVRPLGYRR